MRKILPYILILVIVVQLFAPFTVGMGAKNKVEIQTKRVEAAEYDDSEIGFKNAFKIAEGDVTSTNVSLTSEVVTKDSVSAYFKVTLDTGYADSISVANIYKHTHSIKPDILLPPTFFDEKDFIIVVKEKNGNITGIIDVTGNLLINENGQSLATNYPNGPAKSTIIINPNTSATPNIFAPNKEYNVILYYQATEDGEGWGESIEGLSERKDYYPIATTEFIVGPAGTTTGTANDQKIGVSEVNNSVTNPLDCGYLNFKGCVAMVPYYLLFMPTSAIFSIAGKIFDFAFGYSVQDTSYRSTFVVEGWGIIRDFCNMFFIFILLYIAFGTILNLHGVKPKEMIINVVIIGLLINFSLFATHIIIDASNILARVFYNSESIQITEKNPDGSAKEAVKGEYIKLSEAIVSKINPQELLIQASKVGNIPDKAGMSDESDAGEIGLGTLVIVILLATIVNIVGIIVFISVALIFIARVIGLWLAMIFVPFTFFTYAVPSLQDLEMVGWKKWWPETIKLAFLAPVFIFFMYLIIKFLNLKLDLTNTVGKSGMDFVVAILLPFAFIMILMWKAKDIAKKMSGTIGETITKAGAVVGGVGLAMATGGAAMAMRGTVGRLGNKLATSEFAKTNGALGRGLGNLGKWAGGGSMDLRGVKIAGKGLSDIGLKNVGKAKEGGYAKHLSEKVERRQKRAKELEVSENEELKQKLNKVEMEHQGLLKEYSHEIETLDKRIKTARENASDINSKETTDPVKVAAKKAALATASSMITTTPDDVAKKTAAIAAANAMDTEDPVKVALKKEANDRVAELKEYKKAIKDGKTSFNVTSLTDSTVAPGHTKTIHFTDSGTATGRQNNITNGGKSINQLEDFEIPHAHSKIEKENRNRKWDYAKAKSRWGGRANKEAAHKIRMEAKMNSGEKSH